MNAIGFKQKQVLKKTMKLLREAEVERKNVRFAHFVRTFSAGEIDVLKHAEFADKLGSHLIQLHSEGNRRAVLELFQMLEICLCDEEISLREHALAAIVEFSGRLTGSNSYAIIVELFKPLLTWFECEEKLINGYGIGCSQLHKLAQRLLERREFWKESEQLLFVLQKIYDGRIAKNRAIRDMAVKLQDSLATKSVLKMLVTCYLNDKSELKKTAETILAHLGRRSVVHMVNVLMHSESTEERLQLISLIPEAGSSILPVLRECLQKKPPWYVVRNIVFIVSELNDDTAFDLVQPYLSYKDIRVQQQVVRCIVRSSEEHLKDRLIQALFQVHDELKMPIIMQLARIGGDAVALSLLELLALRTSFEQETYIELLVRLCRAFHLCQVKEVIPALHGLIKERQMHAGPSDPVISAARDTILFLKVHYPAEADLVILETDLTDNGFGFKNGKTHKSLVKRLEYSVKKMVEQGDLESAGKKLFANAVKAARDNDFASAELLRDKILEISPLALSEVIRLGEIIEEERSSSISSQHIAIWSGLYEKLTTEEFNALYFALRHKRFNVDDVIVRAGETDPSLYFVNSGAIILSCRSENRETVLKRLQQGEVVGVAPFFDFSVWTVSMTAQTGSHVHVLSGAKFKELEKKFPDIEDKLQAYCRKYDTIPELLQMAGSDRRKAPRYSVSVSINNMLLDPYGNVGKRMFKGELIDISRGGLRFTVTISSRENARLLLGRQIISVIEIEGKDKLKCFGVIVGGRFQDEGGQEFVVHVNFHQHLEQSSLAQVKKLELQSI